MTRTTVNSGPIVIDVTSVKGAVAILLPTGKIAHISHDVWRAANSLLPDPTACRYGRCVVRYHGRPAEARHAELLPNGFWRVDFVSGLVGCYDEDPVAKPDARQRH